ncbi:hypothetical protein SCACP_37580 [Sporomusa carbonis]|uniref:hypothetical protein n=1 Tax=Sporomusa carbonis TaxID=3076075 RepID=UPI003A6F51B7
MGKGVAIFIEGDTESEFYSKLLEELHSFAPDKRFQVEKVIIRNLKGIGNYKSRAKRVFEKEIVARNVGIVFTVILCYDTDVFDYSANPPVVWSEVEQELKKLGAVKIVHIKAKRSIEDWFLFDKEGILQYLGLPADTHVPQTGGGNTLKTLFKKAGKVYVKGSSTKGFIDSLDVKLIMGSVCSELKNMCKELGIKCKNDNCQGGGRKK